MKKGDSKGPIISAIIGGTFFAVPYLLLSVPVLPSIGIAAVAFGAGNLLFSDNKNDELVVNENETLEEKTRRAKNQINQIYVVMGKIEDKDLVNDINELRSTAVKIVEAVEKAPAKEDKLNTFFNYYLPVTLKILNQYDEIENQGLDTEESTNMMKNTKNIIAKIKESFKTDLSRLYESEIIDTEAEIKVFEKMLNSEGFDNIKIKK